MMVYSYPARIDSIVFVASYCIVDFRRLQVLRVC